MGRLGALWTPLQPPGFLWAKCRVFRVLWPPPSLPRALLLAPQPRHSLWPRAPLSLMSGSQCSTLQPELHTNLLTAPVSRRLGPSLFFLQSRLHQCRERASCLHMAGPRCPTQALLAWPGAFPGSLANEVVVGGHGTRDHEQPVLSSELVAQEPFCASLLDREQLRAGLMSSSLSCWERLLFRLLQSQHSWCPARVGGQGLLQGPPHSCCILGCGHASWLHCVLCWRGLSQWLGAGGHDNREPGGEAGGPSRLFLPPALL